MELSPTLERTDVSLTLSENASRLERLKVGLRALKRLEGAEDDPIAQQVFNAAIDGDTFGRLVLALWNTDEGRELLTDRPTLQGETLDLPGLSALPEGTLGRAFARYFEDNRIQPFTTPFELRSDTDYLIRRYRETHDLVHVVTGYGTDSLGEMEVQAFVAGNLGLRSCWLILAVGALLRQHGLPPIWRYTDRLRAAHRRGRRAKRLLSLRFERHWESPVAEVQHLLGLSQLQAA